MEFFFVNGADHHFADLIIKHKSTGQRCLVMSFGFGVKQVKRLLNVFGQVLLIADSSHSTLNAKAYKTIMQMNNDLPHFKFKPIKTHAKIAFIDNETVIFTSANLSANRRMESYMVGHKDEIQGIENMLDVFGNPEKIFDKKKKSNLFDNDIKDFDFDFDINLDFDIEL